MNTLYFWPASKIEGPDWAEMPVFDSPDDGNCIGQIDRYCELIKTRKDGWGSTYKMIASQYIAVMDLPDGDETRKIFTVRQKGDKPNPFHFATAQSALAAAKKWCQTTHNNQQPTTKGE